MLEKLLNKSRDFLIITDSAGKCLDVGDHFRKVLRDQGASIDILQGQLSPLLPQLLSGDSISLPLDHYGVHASPFSLLHQDEKEIVLIAEDLTPGRTLHSPLSPLRKVEQQWSDKEERIHILLDESSDPIFSFKKDGTYLYVNRTFAHTLGHEQDQIIGRKIWDIFPREEADKRFAMVQKAFDSGKTDTIEVRIPLPDGDKHFLTTVKPIKEQGEKVTFVICISKDITELRQTQGELKILKGVLPICAACKKIRNDRGLWQELEEYISNNSEAVFTHGICSDCVTILYPDLDL